MITQNFSIFILIFITGFGAGSFVSSVLSRKLGPAPISTIAFYAFATIISGLPALIAIIISYGNL